MRTSSFLGFVALTGLVAGLGTLGGCRGGISEQPPVHVVFDMDFQPKLKAYAETGFFSDHRSARMPPEHTVAVGSLRESKLLTFQNADGTYVAENPVPATAENLARGRERYDINCAPCHDRTGTGKGLVGKRWPVAIPSYITDERVSKLAPGEIYAVMLNGKGTMPSYAHQVSVEDRWKIIHYIRALQVRAKG